jgi:hypothetical protein
LRRKNEKIRNDYKRLERKTNSTINARNLTSPPARPDAWSPGFVHQLVPAQSAKKSTRRRRPDYHFAPITGSATAFRVSHAQNKNERYPLFFFIGRRISVFLWFFF